MTSGELRQKFLEFFEKNGHKIVPSSSLVPVDQSVLFTTAGMLQFKQYFLGEKYPYGNNAVSCQKCFRTSDIEEVGDERHLTFFEMLGNFSFGGYGKKEAIKLAKEFLDSINIKIDYVTVFAGDGNVPKDDESKKIWEKLGIKDIREAGRDDNFWGPTGDEGPCGPTTEIYINGIEIWNLVFNEYYQDKNKNLTESSLKGVDTGMGLERLAMVSQGKSNVFETDLFWPGIKEKSDRIIADHIRGAVFLAAEGIVPSNVERGYILRRLLRRAMRHGRSPLAPMAQKVIEIYHDVYPELKSQESIILMVIQNEEEKFQKTLEAGIKRFEKGLDAFELYTTYGFPVELSLELAEEKGINVDIEEFKRKFKEHQEISRAGVEGKFGGGGEFSPKLHTATHLLHAALRQILGDHVKQMGSDITSQRARFDFSHPQKMTDGEIKKVEDLVNQEIKEDLPVKKEEMPLSEALKSGALSFFKEKYPERVSVYSVCNFSREICAGPHIKRTGELGHFRIIKEESSGAGIRRIRAILE